MVEPLLPFEPFIEQRSTAILEPVVQFKQEFERALGQNLVGATDLRGTRGNPSLFQNRAHRAFAPGSTQIE